MAREQGWDHQFTAEFIEQYRRLPCLWKTTSNEYRDRTKMESAYNSLVSFCKSRNIDVDVMSVKRKIQNLRTVFYRAYKKYQSSKRSGARPDKIKKPYLWYFDLLLFVYEQDCPITTSSNMQVGTVASDQEVWTPLEEAHGIPYSPSEASTSSLEKTTCSSRPGTSDPLNHMTHAQETSNNDWLNSGPNSPILPDAPRVPDTGSGYRGRNESTVNAEIVGRVQEASVLLHNQQSVNELIGLQWGQRLNMLNREQWHHAHVAIDEILYKASDGLLTSQWVDLIRRPVPGPPHSSHRGPQYHGDHTGY
ncbi:uncharacterized protein [Hyperolius riggenbachi]|uniref:uncharacterized protein n=1 Tax=Hyperolius riggenbachi TaxID=752182 RepID=UPI0035A301EF